MTWHADTELIVAYASGDVDDAHAPSLEAHLLACPSCRARCGAVASSERLDASWLEIVDRIDRPRLRMLERLLVRIGVTEHTARLIGATPSLQLSWLLSVAGALAFAVLAAYARVAGGEDLLPFLLIAPLVPLAGVAAAFGPGIDPTFEMGLAAPMRGVRLLLARTTAVLSASILLAGVASLLLPGLSWMSMAWLVPSLALTAGSLALATVVHPLRAAGALAFAWVAGVLTVESSAQAALVSFGARAQIAFAGIALVAAAVVAWRRETFDADAQV